MTFLGLGYMKCYISTFPCKVGYYSKECYLMVVFYHTCHCCWDDPNMTWEFRDGLCCLIPCQNIHLLTTVHWTRRVFLSWTLWYQISNLTQVSSRMKAVILKIILSFHWVMVKKKNKVKLSLTVANVKSIA